VRYGAGAKRPIPTSRGRGTRLEWSPGHPGSSADDTVGRHGLLRPLLHGNPLPFSDDIILSNLERHLRLKSFWVHVELSRRRPRLFASGPRPTHSRARSLARENGGETRELARACMRARAKGGSERLSSSSTGPPATGPGTLFRGLLLLLSRARVPAFFHRSGSLPPTDSRRWRGGLPRLRFQVMRQSRRK